MKQNVNHKAYFDNTAEPAHAPIARPDQEPVVEEPLSTIEEVSETVDIENMTKSEHIELLKAYGYSKRDIKSFHSKQDMIDALLEGGQ